MGTQATYHHYQYRLTLGGTGTYQGWRLGVVHTAQVGHQWALGPRVTLDTYAGTISQQRPPYVRFTAGTQAGWRLL